MQLFFHPDLSQTEIILPEDESKHCVRVLRKQKGDEIILIDGKGLEAITEIVDDNPKKCKLEIKIRNQKSNNQKSKIHLIVAPTKNFDRMEWMIEKCIEIGIDEITFIETTNSERTKINLERCEKIAISAIKQSKQYWLPKINSMIKFDALMKEISSKNEDEKRFVAWCETESNDHLLNRISTQPINQSTNQKISILIGPEGDFTSHEIQLALYKEFVPGSLGNHILRTETAALYATTLINAIM